MASSVVHPDNEGVTVSVSGLSSVTGDHYIAKTPETYTYDVDGNKESDGQWDYTWDAENRLIEMVSATATGPQQLLKFEYDYMGRRIRKRVWNNTAGTGSPAEDLKFLYDRWNLIAAVDNSDVLEKSFMWGLDLSGSEQGAGGVGGLLMMTDHVGAADYFYGYDGNGNVVSMVWADDVTATMGVDEAGTEAARYEYGPFGETIRKTGAAADVNPCRFSTKYQDEETGLYYYGYRYYDPETGRWTNRDPIGERGGENLYMFPYNDPVNGVDYLGLIWFEDSECTFLVFLGQMYDPRNAKQNAKLGANYFLGAAEGAAGFARSTGQMIIHPVETYQALCNLRHLTLGDLKCLLGETWDEFIHASPEQQARMIGKIVGDIEAGLLTGAAAKKVLDATKAMRSGGQVAKTTTGAPKTTPALDDLSKAAAAADRNGYTKAGRSLQKHGDRPGSIWPQTKPDPKVANLQAQNLVDDILTTPGSQVIPNPRGGWDVVAPDGRTIRFNRDGSFQGFRE